MLFNEKLVQATQKISYVNSTTTSASMLSVSYVNNRIKSNSFLLVTKFNIKDS